MEIHWASVVAGAFATWLLMVVLCAVTAALERIADSYSKAEDGSVTETAGRIELIDTPTVHDFGAPLVDEYAEKARTEGKQTK